MPYEANTGLGVNNHYGPRTIGGVEGVTKTEGVMNEFVKDLDSAGLAWGFPTGAKGQSLWVTEVDVSQASGTLSGTQTIGGVNVANATPEAPVEITPANTRAVAIGGATGGLVLVKYKKYPPV